MTDHLGPIDFIAVEFPDGHVTADGLREVLAQVDAGTIFLIDLEFVAKDSDGALQDVAAGSLGLAQLGLTFNGANSHLLSREDLEAVAADVSPGSILAVLIYEDRTLSRAVAAWENSGARVLAEGTVDDADLDEALDASQLSDLSVGSSR
jgi:hypothetical protein